MKTNRRMNRFLQIIPGYEGYSTRETRRNDDKLLRESIATCLFWSQGKLETLLGKQVQGGAPSDFEKTEGLIVMVKSLMARVKYASYGESGFFSEHQIPEADLNTIHTMDMRLLEKARELQDSVGSAPIETIKDIIIEMDNMVAMRSSFLRERK